MSLPKQMIQSEDVVSHRETEERSCRFCGRTFTTIKSAGMQVCQDGHDLLVRIFWTEWKKTHP